jgi:hypothetical protein
VTNGLFIRSYPAPGIRVIPTAFAPGINAYFVFCFLPIWAISLFGVILHISDPRPAWALIGLLISISVLFLAVSLVRRFRLEIRIDGISYTSPIRGTSFIGFSETSAVVLIDYRHLSSEATPRRSVRSFTMIITPNVETRKTALKIPLTLFSDSARNELVRLFKPEEWESGT